jgi:predicted dehydrogenase
VKVKVIGAGSIGNHLAHAARVLGWDVLVCDIDAGALDRMRESIYPQRYGEFDNAIELCVTDDAPRGGFDLICVGTPPDVHMEAALRALKEEPRALQIEKPLSTPSLDGLSELVAAVESSGVRAYVGYDHVVGASTRRVCELVASDAIGHIQAIDVEFREHWGGILTAHPWLDGPWDTYLGHWRRGGGASGEHSHAINLWQHLAHVAGRGRVSELSAMMEYASLRGGEFDRLCYLQLRTEGGLVGSVVQDVITQPARKRATIQGEFGTITWICNYASDTDMVEVRFSTGELECHEIHHRRPDDFILELEHIAANLEEREESPLSLVRGAQTMLVIAGAHESQARGSSVRLDYDSGYSHAALSYVTGAGSPGVISESTT